MRKLVFTIVCFLAFFNAEAQKDNHSKYAIKYSPTQLIMGELHFAYEQRIIPQSSIEVALGPTISEIGVPTILFDNLILGGAARESGLGFFGSLSYRYYPISGLATAPRGLYIAPEIKYRLYNTTYVDPGYNLGDKSGKTNQLMFKFHTGYQFWPGSKFSIDVFTAVGVGTTSVTSYSVYQPYDPDTGMMGDAEWFSHSKSRVSFVGAFGVKFGVGGTRKDQ